MPLGLLMTDSDQVRKRLKQAYGSTGGHATRAAARPVSSVEMVIAEHHDLVRRLARRYARSAGGVIDVDDLISVGVMGLIQAHENYDPNVGRPFRTYAEFRVRGAILDELRRIDPLSQPARRKTRQFERALSDLAHELGREPTHEELAEHLDVSLETLHEMRREVQHLRFVSTEDGDIDDIRADLATSRTDRTQLKLALAQALAQLSERDQHVLALYYFHDLNLREIGEVLEVTEARVCQLHKAAVAQLRQILREDGAIP